MRSLSMIGGGLAALLAVVLSVGVISSEAVAAQDSSSDGLVFYWDAGKEGRTFDNNPNNNRATDSEVVILPQNAINALKDLSEGTVVIEFLHKGEAKGSPILFCGSNSSEERELLCIIISRWNAYAAVRRWGVGNQNQALISTSDEALMDSRETIVLSSSDSGGAFMTSRGVALIGPVDDFGFFSDIDGFDSLVIGGLRSSQGQWGYNGKIYRVEVYDRAFTREEARERAYQRPDPCEALPWSEWYECWQRQYQTAVDRIEELASTRDDLTAAKNALEAIRKDGPEHRAAQSAYREAVDALISYNTNHATAKAAYDTAKTAYDAAVTARDQQGISDRAAQRRDAWAELSRFSQVEYDRLVNNRKAKYNELLLFSTAEYNRLRDAYQAAEDSFAFPEYRKNVALRKAALKAFETYEEYRRTTLRRPQSYAPGMPEAPAVELDDDTPGSVLQASWSMRGSVHWYNVRYRPKGGVWSRDNMRRSYEGAVISGLKPGTRYEVQIQAANNRGHSEWSPSGEARTPGPLDAPDAPTVELDDYTPESMLQATWSAADGAHWYNIRYRPKGGGVWSRDNVLRSYEGAVISGLKPGTRYEVQIQAANNEGHSEWSPSGEVRTPGPPDTPIILTVELDYHTPESMLVTSWSAVDGALWYNVRYRPKGGVWWSQALEQANILRIGEEALIGRLKSGTRYEFQIQAANNEGHSEWSPSGEIRTYGPPDTPIILTVKPAKDIRPRLMVNWDPVDSNPGPATYVARVRPKGTYEPWRRGRSGTSTHGVFPFNLSPDTEYEVQIQAHNSIGDSDWSPLAYGRTNP